MLLINGWIGERKGGMYEKIFNHVINMELDLYACCLQAGNTCRIADDW